MVVASATRDNTSNIAMRYQDTELQVRARCEPTCPLAMTDADSGYALEVNAGAELVVTATGMLPESLVDVWVYSEPQLLGSTVLGADGSLSMTVPLSTVSPGNHTLRIHSVAPTGDRLSFHVGLTVHRSDVSPPAVLPQTGRSDLMAEGVLAATMLLAGLLLVSRRRNTAERM